MHHSHQRPDWQLAEAKNRFSEVVRCVLSEGPQKILRRDGNVIIISEHEYMQLKGKKINFKDFLLNETPDLTDLDLTRSLSVIRDILL